MVAAKCSVIVFSVITVGLFLLTQCVEKADDEKPVIKNAFGEQFAGSAACVSCHKETTESHKKTAHYLTSQPASANAIKGNFEEGKNRFVFSNFQYVSMEKRDTGFYQVQYTNGIEVRRQQFDMVIGSGTKGQTSVYRRDNKLYQMPIFYYAAKNEWANIPGFPGQVIFSSAITTRCLECHSTYAQ